MPLATRLTLVLLVSIAICFSVQAYVNVRLRRHAQLDEAAREVRDHGTALEVALDAFLRDHHLDDLTDLTEDLSRADRILGVMIFDGSDQPVEASRSVRGYREAFREMARAARVRRARIAEIRRYARGDLYAYAFPIGTRDAVPRGSAVVLRRLDYIDSNMRAYAREIASVAAVVMLIVALGTWLVVRITVSRPVSSLARGFEAVAAGALSTEIVIERRDEMGRLAGAFNEMTAALRQARAELTTKTAANVALERRLQHAQRLALIGQMAASVAHEIGSPLNVIVGRARYALDKTCADERNRRHFEEILAGGSRISSVIEQWLRRSTESRQRAERISLSRLANDLLRFLEAELERARIEARLVVEEDVSVMGRADELEQVVLNLCMNAIQAQPNGGRLEIAIRRTTDPNGAESGELTISDRGPGVPAEHRARLFEPFFTTKSASEGTGLGLAICDEIVRRHGGVISLDPATNVGAAFRVAIPRQGAGTPREVEAVA